MTRNELNIRIAAILTTLFECNGCPESTLYVAICNMNLADWELIRALLLRVQFITIKGNWVTLTELGAETAAKLEKLIAK